MPTKFRMIKCPFQNYIFGNNNTVVYLKKKSTRKCILSQAKIRNSLELEFFILNFKILFYCIKIFSRYVLFSRNKIYFNQ